MIINIDTAKVLELVKSGDKILFSADGEKVIVELNEMQAMIETALHDVKKNIQESALKLDPTFTSIQGDRVKVSYRAYGTRYRIDQTKLQEIPAEFYKSKVTYSPEIKAIEEFVDKQGGLPDGILENVREKQIQITVKEEVK